MKYWLPDSQQRDELDNYVAHADLESLARHGIVARTRGFLDRRFGERDAFGPDVLASYRGENSPYISVEPHALRVDDLALYTNQRTQFAGIATMRENGLMESRWGELIVSHEPFVVPRRSGTHVEFLRIPTLGDMLRQLLARARK